MIAIGPCSAPIHNSQQHAVPDHTRTSTHLPSASLSPRMAQPPHSPSSSPSTAQSYPPSPPCRSAKTAGYSSTVFLVGGAATCVLLFGSVRLNAPEETPIEDWACLS
ncbi:hypothetical protein FIBSPDRAFT_957102 [Athelia psychrophila]|uniref:Uncharacterized protein n=1 Tax=Athelia psychrophila TaxID=1759441 RepID=A0A166G4V1_9AGAM|nr:hypothetical protein FIBSPDRAFT_957102 [Fibularhizoctonia sp. CBS 109695]